jgi:hypothetical protein
MTHRLFGTNNNAKDSVHLVHPSKIASLQPEKLAVHKILAFLGKKICCFVHDFHPDWIARLNLPLSDGLHNQLQPHQVDGILRRLVFPYHDTARLEKNRTKMLHFQWSGNWPAGLYGEADCVLQTLPRHGKRCW